MTSGDPELKEKLLRSLQKDLAAAKQAVGDRSRQRLLLLERKREIVAVQQPWIDKHLHLLKDYCRDAPVPDGYVPANLRLVICQEQWHHDLWRLIKLTHWSMPPNEYVGRRLRILVFDGPYVFGLIGMASCIWGLTARDKWVGWDLQTKTKNLSLMADAYVLGAIPPFNGKYRGSKLLAYLVASNEIRELWESKYQSPLAGVVTTTLFGHSAVLNRVRHKDKKLWVKVGNTRGLGTMHFSFETDRLAKQLLDTNSIGVPSRLTSGPNWKLRFMRTAIEKLGLRAEDYLMHGYKRGIYVLQYAANSKEFLRGEDGELQRYDFPLNALMDSWELYAYRNRLTYE